MLETHISRRRFLTGSALVAGGAVTAPLLGACDASSGGSSSDGDAVTLTVMYKSNELTKEHIADFEAKNTGIKVNFVEFDGTRLNAMLASNEPPDFVRSPAVGSAGTNAQGLAAPLDDYLEKSTVLKKDDLLPVNDGFRWDGKRSGQGPLYGIVKDWSQDATLWYNRALFEQAKIPPLSTTEAISYDELLEIAKKLTKKSGGKTQVYGLGVEWAWNLWAPISMMILQQGGQLYNADLTETDMTTPEALRALKWYVDFAQAGVGPTSLDPAPDGADLSLVLAERMAITQDGYWYGGNFVSGDGAKLQDDIAMAPAPVMGDKRISPTYVGWGAYIPAKAKNKDQAWKFMEYYMAGPPSEERAKSGWGMPALASQLTLMPQELPYQKQAFQTQQAELQYAGQLPDSPYIGADSWSSALDKNLQRVIKKEITVEAAGKAITDEVNKLMKQGKDQIG